MMVEASKKMFLLGSGISHSASPAHWQKTFEEKGLDWTYELADISDETQARKFILSRDYVAINITTPWKKLAFECADYVDGASIFAGGCNFLVNLPDKLRGSNVDGAGCVKFLESTGFNFKGQSVFVCGFGPTAKSVAFACKIAGANVTMLSRTVNEERLKQCAGDDIQLQTYDCELADANLVINATTLGMKSGDSSPIALVRMSKDCIYFDCIYGHGETQFIKNAKSVGAVCYDGAGMLEAQAVACEEILF